MRVLVLGGTGFVGSAAVRAICGAGHEVTVYNRGETLCELPEGVRRITGRREEMAERADELRAHRADVVVDTIAYTEGSAALVAGLFAGCVERAVILSSMDVYRAYGRLRRREPGPPEPTPFAETAALRAELYPYREAAPRERDDPRRWMDDYEKILVERAFRAESGLHATVMRLPMVYGPGDPQHRFADILQQMVKPKAEILLERSYAGWRSSWGFVDDVAHAISLAVSDRRAGDQIYNICETHGNSQQQLFSELAAAAGWDGAFRAVSLEDAPSAARAASLAMDFRHDLLADSRAIRRDLRYSELTPRGEALARTVQDDLARSRASAR